MENTPIWIDREDLEREIASLPVDQPVEGFFGPRSASWKISRESALFAGSWRAALLQLAHPWVAQSIADHSKTLSRPLERFRSTFRIVFSMVFGSTDHAIAAARYLHTLHTTIRGRVPENEVPRPFPPGDRYGANETHAMIWVLVTLIDSAVRAYEEIVAPLDPETKDQYLEETRDLAALFGINRHHMPRDWQALQRYFDEQIAGPVITITPTARRLADGLFASAWFVRGARPLHRQLATVWMPPTLVTPLGLSDVNLDAAGNWMALYKQAYHLMPPTIRYLPSYHEACERLKGRHRPGLATRLGNRLWLAQPSLVLGDAFTDWCDSQTRSHLPS